MLSKEHMELMADVLAKYKIFQNALFNHFDELVKHEKVFDIEDEAEKFKAYSKEGVQLINAQKQLDKFRRDNLSKS